MSNQTLPDAQMGPVRLNKNNMHLSRIIIFDSRPAQNVLKICSQLLFDKYARDKLWCRERLQ